jgi:hypothetical protein
MVITGSARAETSHTLDTKASELEADLRRQETALDREVGDLAKIGFRLQEAQEQFGSAAARVEKLEREIKGLDRSLEAHKQAATESRARFQVRLAAAYKGQQFDTVVMLLDGLFGGEVEGESLNAVAARMLAEDRESMRLHREDRRVLEDTIRQLERKRAEYDQSREEERARARDLEQREAELEGSIQALRQRKGRTEAGLDDLGERIEVLEAQDENQETQDEAQGKARTLDPPASGGGDLSRSEEARIAREDIVNEPVEELPLVSYRKLYREAAEGYGFGPDWYVLMAVGKVESNHGENMGPSSAGALGPMQFLPSTWKVAGVDGNGDGVANIMDPEDAIPAAAKYLAAGGAPEDWYAALFAYNHADWYVREVLEIAEQYRLLAGDSSVGPYGVPQAPETTSVPSNTEGPPAPSVTTPGKPPNSPAEEEETTPEPEPMPDAEEDQEPERTTPPGEETTGFETTAHGEQERRDSGKGSKSSRFPTE